MKDVPADYYERLAAVDSRHWWARGVVEIEARLIAPWLRRPAATVLDAGCGTGAFLDFVARRAPTASLAGVDTSAEAVAVARRRVPAADLRVGAVSDLPFADRSFAVAALNDVLQHVDETEVGPSLRELLRVLAPDGALVVRTNGARRGRRVRSDWRLYDETTLRVELESEGFAVRRLTFANFAFSFLAELRGASPQAPTETSAGIPADAGRVRASIGHATLAVEGAMVGHGVRIPWGHTLLALAVPRA